MFSRIACHQEADTWGDRTSPEAPSRWGCQGTCSSLLPCWPCAQLCPLLASPPAFTCLGHGLGLANMPRSGGGGTREARREGAKVKVPHYSVYRLDTVLVCLSPCLSPQNPWHIWGLSGCQILGGVSDETGAGIPWKTYGGGSPREGGTLQGGVTPWEGGTLQEGRHPGIFLCVFPQRAQNPTVVRLAFTCICTSVPVCVHEYTHVCMTVPVYDCALYMSVPHVCMNVFVCM